MLSKFKVFLETCRNAGLAAFVGLLFVASFPPCAEFTEFLHAFKAPGAMVLNEGGVVQAFHVATNVSPMLLVHATASGAPTRKFERPFNMSAVTQLVPLAEVPRAVTPRVATGWSRVETFASGRKWMVRLSRAPPLP